MTGIHEDVIKRLTADVAVVGYGPVGRLLALLLGRRGKRVVVIERQARGLPVASGRALRRRDRTDLPGRRGSAGLVTGCRRAL